MKFKKLLAILFIIALLSATLVLALKVSGDLLVTGKVTTEKVVFEVDTTNHYINDNSTCVIIHGDTSELTIC